MLGKRLTGCTSSTRTTTRGQQEEERRGSSLLREPPHDAGRGTDPYREERGRPDADRVGLARVDGRQRQRRGGRRLPRLRRRSGRGCFLKDAGERNIAAVHERARR